MLNHTPLHTVINSSTCFYFKGTVLLRVYKDNDNRERVYMGVPAIKSLCEDTTKEAWLRLPVRIVCIRIQCECAYQSITQAFGVSRATQ
jgi:hypothetical protein